MKKFDTEIKKYSQKVTLKAAEKRMLREHLVSYMEYHPLPKTSTQEKKVTHVISTPTPYFPKGILSEPYKTFTFTTWHFRIAGGVFALLLIVAPFAAERAVPGDVLYFIKTGINETIQGSLASSPYERIEFETKLLERRMAEARVLADEGKLTEDVKEQIEETVKAHTSAVQTNLAELRTQDADGAALAQIAFNASLEVQSATLDSEGFATNTDAIASLLTVVNEARDEVVSQQGSSTPSYEGLLARVELETTRAQELFDSVKISATSVQVNDIERRLRDANRLIKEAKENHVVRPEKAANDLAMTLGLLQKLIVFMSNLDVREKVALDEIVPVVLSDTERTDLIKENLRVVNNLKTQVTQRVEGISGEGLTEKVEEGLIALDTMLVTIDTALQSNDVATAESTIRDALALAQDLLSITERGGEEIPPEEVVGESPSESVATTTETGTESE